MIDPRLRAENERLREMLATEAKIAAATIAALRAALTETLAHIDHYEDSMGHSYCDLNVGGDWASDDCTCDFGAKRERWGAALAAAKEAKP